MIPEQPVSFGVLEAENVRLRAALSDCNTGLNDFATKLVVVGTLIGFTPDQPVDQIRAQVKMRLRLL